MVPVLTAKNTVAAPVLLAGSRLNTSTHVAFGSVTGPVLTPIEKVPSLAPVSSTFRERMPSPIVIELFAIVAVIDDTVPVPAAVTVADGIIPLPAGQPAGL